MKILQGSCSESVMKFGTSDPKVMQQILQWLADEISANTGFEPHQKQKIPLFKTAKQYDTKWNKELSYHGKVRDKYHKQIAKNWEDRDSGKITQKEALKRYAKIEEKMSKKIYPNTLLECCAGLGDNEAVITVVKDGFILNIGSNDITENVTNWIENIKSLNIKVEEAETCPELQKMARDCTCGLVYGF